MKLRIKDNSIRLRLTQTEVERIGNGDQIHSNLNFPGGEKVSYLLVACLTPREDEDESDLFPHPEQRKKQY